MHLVAVPPGAAAEPHYHDGFETAIYQLEGRVETRYGDRLERSVISEAGDFLFIPPGQPHEAINLSHTEPARRSSPATIRPSRRTWFPTTADRSRAEPARPRRGAGQRPLQLLSAESKAAK